MHILCQYPKELTRRCILRHLSTTTPRFDSGSEVRQTATAPKSSLSARLSASNLAGIPIYNAPRAALQESPTRSSNDSNRTPPSTSDSPNQLNRRSRYTPQQRASPFSWSDGVVQSSLSGRLWQRLQAANASPSTPSPPSSLRPRNQFGQSQPTQPPKETASKETMVEEAMTQVEVRANVAEGLVARQEVRRKEEPAAITQTMELESTDLSALFGGTPHTTSNRTSTATATEADQHKHASSKAPKPKKKPVDVKLTLTSPSLSKIRVRLMLESRAGDYSRYSSVRPTTRHTLKPVLYARYALKRDLKPMARRQAIDVIRGLVKRRTQARA